MSLRKTLTSIILASASIVGLSGCGRGELPQIKETRYFNGSVLQTYQDKNGNYKIDNIKVDFIGSFPVGSMSYNRSPTERELKDSKKILASENIFLEQ